MSRSVKGKSRSGRIRTALLTWYATHRRDLPWRRTADPYRVWVSEVMLQQTRVDAVISYYERWLAAFPNVQALANADLHDVLIQWQGLGYYSRARNLHIAARLIRERHGGELPADYQALRALPGIGEYTAGAIASIAYNQLTAAIDGNVRRVLSRLFDTAKPRAATTRMRTQQLIDPLRPGDFNQALMDLGATVCTPRNPSCNACPLAFACRALAHGTTRKRPLPKYKTTVPHYHVTTLVSVHDRRVLLQRRAETGLLGGLWEFPEVSQLPDGAYALGEIMQTYSHKRVTHDVYLANGRAGERGNGRWVRISELDTYPMSIAQRKIEALLVKTLTRTHGSISIEA